MLEFATCVLEVIVVLLALNLVLKKGRGMYTSDPSIAAAIGNAANRKFENTQASVIGMSDKGFMYTPPHKGFLSPPESMAWSGGSL